MSRGQRIYYCLSLVCWKVQERNFLQVAKQEIFEFLCMDVQNWKQHENVHVDVNIFYICDSIM